MTSNIKLLKVPEACLSKFSYADAIIQSIDVLKYPDLTENEQYFIYLIIIEAYLKLKDLDLAMENIRAVDDLVPQNLKLKLEFYLLKAEYCIEVNDLDEALEILDDFEFELEKSSSFSANRIGAAWFLRGRVLLKKEYCSQALDCFAEAEKLFQDELNLCIVRAEIATISQNLDELKSCAAELIGKYPYYSGLTQICSNLSIMMGTDKRALIFMEKSVEFAEIFNEESEIIKYCKTLARFGKYQEIALNLISDNSEDYESHMELLLLTGEYEKLEQYLTLHQDEEYSCVAQALFSADQRQIKALLSDKKIISAALCYYLQKQYGKAGKLLQELQSTEISKENVAVFLLMSECYFQSNQLFLAVSYARRAENIVHAIYGNAYFYVEITMMLIEELVKVYEIRRLPEVMSLIHENLEIINGCMPELLETEAISEFLERISLKIESL